MIESKDGWEQIGGDFNGTRYGIWVSPSKLSLIFTSFVVLLIGSIFLIVFGAQGEDVLLISGISLLLISLGLLGWYIYLIVLMNKSRIEVDMIYMGFRKEKNKRKKLGKPLLDSIIKDLGQANDMMTLPNLSEFLDGISDFDTDKNLHDKLQLSISYSLHTKLTNNKSVLERDFTLLRDGLLQSMVVSSKEFTPIFKDPQFIHTETQIHKKEEEFIQLTQFLSSKFILTLFEATRYRMKYLEKHIFEMIPDITYISDFPKTISDISISTFFKLNKMERNLIHTYHKKKYNIN